MGGQEADTAWANAGFLVPVLDEAERRFGHEPMRRIRGFIENFSSGVGPRFPGLPEQTWYEPEGWPALLRVKETLLTHYAAIRAEAESLLRAGPASEEYRSASDFELPRGAWTSLMLRANGVLNEDSAPRTASVVGELTDLLLPGGETFFSVLGPRQRIPAHRDPSNAQLTCHLVLIADPGTGMRVGEDRRSYAEREVHFFDHSNEHEAWNDSDRHRVVLLMALRHPAFTKTENDALDFFSDLVLRFTGRGLQL